MPKIRTDGCYRFAQASLSSILPSPFVVQFVDNTRVSFSFDTLLSLFLLFLFLFLLSSSSSLQCIIVHGDAAFDNLAVFNTVKSPPKLWEDAGNEAYAQMIAQRIIRGRCWVNDAEVKIQVSVSPPLYLIGLVRPNRLLLTLSGGEAEEIDFYALQFIPFNSSS